MARTDSGWAGRICSTAAAVIVAGVLFAGSPVWAISANFDDREISDFGFDWTDPDLPAANLTIDASVPFLRAAEGIGADVEFTGSTDLCILVQASSICQPTVSIGQLGPVSFLVTLTISAINTPEITGPFTLLLTDLITAGDPAYSKSDVSVDLNPPAMPGLDTNAVNFSLDPNNGVNGFDPFVVVRDEEFINDDLIRHYLGWTVELGETVTFKYDVASGPILSATPQLLLNAIPVVVPELGTALLMGLGLAGLGFAGRSRN